MDHFKLASFWLINNKAERNIIIITAEMAIFNVVENLK